MWTNKYKMARNHKLFPALPQKHVQSKITTFVFLTPNPEKQYELHLHPSLPTTFVMFNQTEYLQRQCSTIIRDEEPDKTIKNIAESYPSQGGETLTFFISNNPEKTEKILMGNDQTSSLLSLTYKELTSKKELSSEIFLSIVGVQNQNSLTDQLYFQWLQKGSKMLSEPSHLKSVIAAKSRITLAREGQNQAYYAENISRHRIESQQKLKQLLKKYNQVKKCLQGWVENQKEQQSYLMGEIYILSEAKYDSSSSTITPKKSHYIFRINQYIRTTSPLMLSLSINLKRLHNSNFKLLEVQQYKVFKLLSKCFRSRSFSYFLFLQVGEYQTLKEQHLCLAPTSDFLTSKPSLQSHQSDYVYSKYYLQNPSIMKVITGIQSSMGQKQKKHMQILIKEHEDEIYPAKMRVKTKSYHCDTVSSVQKRMERNHLLAEEGRFYQKFQLQNLIHQTGKIFRLPSYKKASLDLLATPGGGSKGNLLSQMRKLIGNETRLKDQTQETRLKDQTQETRMKDQTPKKGINKDPSSNFRKKLKSLSPKHMNSIAKGSKLVGSASQSSKYYFQIRAWLDQVYGKSQSKKIKNFYNDLHKGTVPNTDFSSYQKEVADEKEMLERNQGDLQQKNQQEISGEVKNDEKEEDRSIKELVQFLHSEAEGKRINGESQLEGQFQQIYLREEKQI